MARRCILTATACLVLAAGIAQAGGDPVAGKKKAQTCASCHGEKGRNSQAPQYPKLAGQHESYLYRALLEYKTGERENAVMSGMVSNLSKQDMRDLAAYFATREPAVYTLPLDDGSGSD